MSHRIALMSLSFLAGLAMQTAYAQGNAAFANLVADPKEQSMVIDAAKRSNVVLESACRDALFKISNQFSIYDQLSFDDAGNLRAGAWKQVVDYTGCGAKRILNVLVSIGHGLAANAHPLMPGTTHADPRLQLDVFQSPAMQSQIQRWRDPNCMKAYVSDTTFVNRESSILPGARESAWHEVWTVATCARTESVSVTFSPDSTGTSFALSLLSSDPNTKDGRAQRP